MKTDAGEIATDLVITAAGITPATEWRLGTVSSDDRGYLHTDPYLRTNLPDVYAIGDDTLVYSVPAQTKVPIALDTVARREARYLAEYIFAEHPARPFGGVVGSSALSVFDYHFADSGLNTYSAGRDYDSVDTAFYADSSRPAYVPEAHGNPTVCVHLVFDPTTHRLLGGAVLSTYDDSATGHVLALAITHGHSLEDLAEADFFFQPGFDRTWSLRLLAETHASGEPRLVTVE